MSHLVKSKENTKKTDKESNNWGDTCNGVFGKPCGTAIAAGAGSGRASATGRASAIVATAGVIRSIIVIVIVIVVVIVVAAAIIILIIIGWFVVWNIKFVFNALTIGDTPEAITTA